MTEPVSFDSTTPRFGLPFLFVGQAQREVYINESLVLIDALLHCAIEGMANTPPTAPEDGHIWLIGTTPQGEWSAFAGRLACRQSGHWLYVTPCDGMAVFDRTAGRKVHFRNGWVTPSTPTTPTGGSTIDSEARASIGELVAVLRSAGLLAPA